MALNVKHKWTWDEFCASMVLLDPLFFALMFWEEDLTIPRSRIDLPAEWLGRQVISREQRIMLYDGAVYLLYRDAMPEQAADSSQKVALRTSRKIAKCIAGDTVLYDAETGARATVRQLANGERIFKSILTLGDDWKLKPTSDFIVFPQPSEHTIKITTRSGLTITTTLDHPFLTGPGWTEAQELAVGDLVAVAKTSSMPLCDTSGLSRDEVVVLAYLIGDGCITGTNQTPSYTSAEPRTVEHFQAALHGIAPGVYLKPSRSRPFDYQVMSGQKMMRHIATNPVRLLLERVGLWGTNSHTKFIPDDVFRLDRNGLREFLRCLFATDGYATVGEAGGAHIGYASVSHQLVSDVRELLLRFGIFVRPYQKAVKYNGGVSYSLEICDAQDVLTFAREIGIFTKEEAVEQCVIAATAKLSSLAKSKHDRLPVCLVRSLIEADGISPYMAGHRVGQYTKFPAPGSEISRSKARAFVEASALPKLSQLVDGDVYWDEVKSIEDAGEQETYDLTVQDTHNFVSAGGIITHNTLFLESLAIQVALTKTAPGIQEGMIHTPRESHMAPVRNRIEKKLTTVPLFKLMFSGFDRENGILNFKSGWVWHFRIEGSSKTGVNMVGLRNWAMFGDEADYSQESAHFEREQAALPGCAQRWGGVPRGVRGVFWRVCNDSANRAGWSIQRYDMRSNPLYHSEKAWNEQVAGDYHSQRVQTQVLGRDGEEAISSFPVIPINTMLPSVTRIMGGVEYQMNQDSLGEFLRLPVRDVQADGWMIHLDYGYAPSPTELGISYLKFGTWHVLSRLEIMRLDVAPTANLIHAINTQVLPAPAALIVVDAHGQGRGVLSSLHTDARWTDMKYDTRAIAVGFEGTTQLAGVYSHKKCKQIVRQDHDGYWTCDTCQIRLFDDNELTPATLSTKVYLTDELKEAFANGQRVLDSQYTQWPAGAAIILGSDPALNDELSGTTEIKSQGGMTRYITPGDADHKTDMLRCLVSGALRWLNLQGGDYDVFEHDDFGWADSDLAGSNWRSPWSTANSFGAVRN